MLRFALFSAPDEGPPLFKDHICVNHRVVSQEGDYCNMYNGIRRTSCHFFFYPKIYPEVYPTCNEEVLDDMIELFENVLQYYVLVIDDISGTCTLFQSLRDLLATLISDKEGRVRSMRRGRPEISVSLEQLRYLVEQGFSARGVGVMFGCSKRTILRRAKKHGILLRKYSSLSDTELVSIISEITSLFPRSGEKTISGNFKSRGILIQRERVRESL